MTKRLGSVVAVLSLLSATSALGAPAEDPVSACGAQQRPDLANQAHDSPAPGPDVAIVVGCELPPLPSPCGGCAPGQVEPLPPLPPAAQPPPAPAPPPAPSITNADLDAIMRAPVPAEKNTLAALTAITFGFGMGHSFQDRWSEDGSFFTLTESLSAAAVLTGAFIAVDLDRDRRDLGHKIMLYGGLSWAVFHAWGAIDVLTYNARLHRRYRQAKHKLGTAAAAPLRAPYLAPVQAGSGAAAGVTFGF